MDVHRYNKRTGYIDKSVNLTAVNAELEYRKVIQDMKYDPFATYYRVTLVDNMRHAIIKDSDHA